MKRAFILPCVFGLLWSATAALPAQAAGIFHHPRAGGSPAIGNLGWSSSNWSGYAITGGPFTSVTAQWKVPAVSATRGATYSSSWVGIDGFNNSSLIQTGTEQDYYSGSAHYGAWWEILPAPATFISTITVHAGDLFNASIARGTGGLWTISINDVTSGHSFSTTLPYSGPLTSAEWIQEAPTVNGRLAHLAHYGLATFDPGTANGASPNLMSTNGGKMVQGGKTVSTPSNPDGDSDGFNAHYGATAPSPPAS